MVRLSSSWNSPKTFQTPNPAPPKEKHPRCPPPCGGLFPLDTHPVTGEKICAKCYAEATR